jgi:hypothetical protein
MDESGAFPAKRRHLGGRVISVRRCLGKAATTQPNDSSVENVDRRYDDHALRRLTILVFMF